MGEKRQLIQNTLIISILVMSNKLNSANKHVTVNGAIFEKLWLLTKYIIPESIYTHQ